MRIVLFAALLLFALPLRAQEDASEDRYGQFFNGAFVEVSARGGLTDVSGSQWGGWIGDVGLRQAFPMHLLDTRLAFRHEEFQTPGLDKLSVNALEISGAFHPLYLALLFSDWWGYVLAGWYVELQAGVHYTSVKWLDNKENDFGFAYGIGTGLDVPLTDPDRGWSIWLNALYRYRRQDFDFDSGGEIELHGHTGFLGLAFRANGLLF